MGAHPPSTSASRLSLRTLWLGVGWIGVVSVIYFTLAPELPQIDLENGDKLEHLLAYASLMLWFAQVRTDVTERRITAVMLLALGVALEFAQGLTDYRVMSLADAAANSAGIALGWLAAPPRSPNLYAWIHARSGLAR